MKTAKLLKEFECVFMTEESCSDYMKCIKRIVSELKDCLTLIKQ